MPVTEFNEGPMFVRIYWGRAAPGAWPAIEAADTSRLQRTTPGLQARLVTQDVNDPESMFTVTLRKDRGSVETWKHSAEYRDAFPAAVKPFIIGSQSVSLSKVVVGSLEQQPAA